MCSLKIDYSHCLNWPLWTDSSYVSFQQIVHILNKHLSLVGTLDVEEPMTICIRSPLNSVQVKLRWTPHYAKFLLVNALFEKGL